ncbi:MAG: glucose-6-phosphate isomerase [Alphaproteobacteria bacterium]|nr:MAG: glucose-6-phosphate isomerase [Alphaproteobacteria bacterium]
MSNGRLKDSHRQMKLHLLSSANLRESNKSGQFMPYLQKVDGCLKTTIGEAGLSDKDLAPWLEKAGEALENLRALYEASSLPLLRLPEWTDDLGPARDAAKILSADADHVVIFGIGGSSLGGATLAALRAPDWQGPELHFLDSPDPDRIAAALSPERLAKTKFLCISKSGSTAETLIQTLMALEAFKAAAPGLSIADHFIVIAMPGDNPLRRLGQEHGCRVLDHHPQVGGRFSVLSNVGMIPALLSGHSPEEMRAGAAEVLKPILDGASPQDVAPAIGAAIAIGLHKERGVNTNVLMPYGSRLARLGDWYAQLWAESLGKDGEGTSPLGAQGPVDQHSLLQLFLAGPNDKFHTIVTSTQIGRGPVLGADAASDARLVYLTGHAIGDLMEAEQRATIETLVRNQRPTRHIHVEEPNERTLGGLLMHFMLETIIAAHLLGVEPFDQPAVEEGKVLARRYIGEIGK